MKFTILSHAGMLVSHKDTQIVFDPWLIGSCYWRSWWNFPEPPQSLIESLRADFIYITHLHWDHFHGPSLKKYFDPQTKILVPKFPTQRMVRDLEWLGFKNVSEVPHGGEVQLGEDFFLYSYQFGPCCDSAALLRAGNHTLLNANDTKLFGLPLRQITERFPKIDFVFRSHSSASAIPYCVDDYERTLGDFRSQLNYSEEFCRFALSTGARYAIPFASNHCFLHKDTQKFNKTIAGPEMLPAIYQNLAGKVKRMSECIIMPPGSSWSETEGFQIMPFDYSRRAEYVAELANRYEIKLAHQYEIEAQAYADYNAFREYFESFLRAIPWLARKWLRSCFVFRFHDTSGNHAWFVDIAACKLGDTKAKNDHCIIIETPALVLNDCTRNKMFSVWTGSKRLNIILLSPEDLKKVISFFILLEFYELDLLPVWKCFSLRSLGVMLRRWREVVEAGYVIFNFLILGRRLNLSERLVRHLNLSER